MNTEVILKYKAHWNDKAVVKIDRFFPSSKNGSACNYINQDLTLKDSTWTCSSGKIKHYRDFNASKRRYSYATLVNNEREYVEKLNDLWLKTFTFEKEDSNTIYVLRQKYYFVLNV